MINIINKSNFSVLLLQDWVYTKKPSRYENTYALCVSERTAQKLIPVIEKREKAKKPEYRTQADNKLYIVPTNIRLEGSYESEIEANYVSGKLQKALRHLNENAEFRSADWYVDVIANGKYLPSVSVTPKYTNGTSNVIHHIEWMDNNQEERFENFLQNATKQELQPQRFQTFKEFILERESPETRKLIVKEPNESGKS